MNVGDLMKYVKDNKVDAEVILHKGRSGMKSEEAAAILGVGVEKIIKALLFSGDDGKKAIVILQGSKRADSARLGLVNPRLVKPEAVKEILGYTPGSIPPICLPAEIPKFLDSAVLEQDYVYGSACNEFAGLKIRPAEILAHNKNISILPN